MGRGVGVGWGGNASKPLLMKTSAYWHSHLSHREGSRQNWHGGVNELRGSAGRLVRRSARRAEKEVELLL